MRKIDFQSRTFRGCIATAFVAVGVFGGVTAVEAGSPFVTIDIPGAGTGVSQGTYATAINSKNVVTGHYSDSSGVNHGFIGTATGTITTFDAPDAPGGGTEPTSINKEGVVAGYYTTEKNHGFVRHADGTFEEFYLGNDTTPTAINGKGVVTGSGGGNGGFVRTRNGNITQFSVSGAVVTSPLAINSAGTVAGRYYDGSNFSHGFIRTRDGSITTFDVPGGFVNTYADGVDTAGDVTGYAWTGGITPAYVGFVRKASDGSFSIFYNIPGCQVNYVFPSAINTDGTVVGQCYDNNFITRGFTRTSDGTVTSYAEPNSAAGTFPSAISAKGKSVGFYEDSQQVSHGFLLQADRQ